MAYAHSDQSSPILRGLFVRERLLCQASSVLRHQTQGAFRKLTQMPLLENALDSTVMTQAVVDVID